MVSCTESLTKYILRVIPSEQTAGKPVSKLACYGICVQSSASVWAMITECFDCW